MGHRNFRGRVSQSQRRKKLWADLNVDRVLGEDLSITLLQPGAASIGISPVAVAGFTSSGAPALLESTLLRLRGWVDVPKSVIGTIGGSDQVSYAFGIGFVSEEAFQAGAVPNPATGSGLDWDGWMFVRQSDQAALDAVGTRMDVKSMRKWQSGDALIFVFGAASNSVAPINSPILTYSARGLFLLA